MCNFATLVFALQHADNTLYNRALDLADHWDASGEKDTVQFISPLPQTPITPKARRRKKVYPTVPVRTYFPFPSASGIALYAEWCESCHRCGSRSLKITKKTVASPPLHGCLSHSCARVRERVCVCERERCAAPRMDRNHTAAWRSREKMKARKPWSVKSAFFVNSHTLTAPWRCAQKHGQTV